MPHAREHLIGFRMMYCVLHNPVRQFVQEELAHIVKKSAEQFMAVSHWAAPAIENKGRLSLIVQPNVVRFWYVMYRTGPREPHYNTKLICVPCAWVFHIHGNRISKIQWVCKWTIPYFSPDFPDTNPVHSSHCSLSENVNKDPIHLPGTVVSHRKRWKIT